MRQRPYQLPLLIVLVLVILSSGWLAFSNLALRHSLRADEASIFDMRASLFQRPIPISTSFVEYNTHPRLYGSQVHAPSAPRVAHCKPCSDAMNTSQSDHPLVNTRLAHGHPASIQGTNSDRGPFNNIRQFSLIDLGHRYAKPDVGSSSFTLFIFFSPTDCPACLHEAAVWEKLFLDAKALRLSVLGIVDQAGATEIQPALNQLSITFPIVYDSHSVLRRLYQIKRTPYKVLVNANGTVVMLDPANEHIKAQIRFNNTIRATLRQRRGI